MLHDSQKIIFSKTLFYFFQYGKGRILKIFHFWASYKFPLDLKLHLILVLYGLPYTLEPYYAQECNPALCNDSAIPNMNALKIANSREYKLHLAENWSTRKLLTHFKSLTSFSWLFFGTTYLGHFKTLKSMKDIVRTTNVVHIW